MAMNNCMKKIMVRMFLMAAVAFLFLYAVAPVRAAAAGIDAWLVSASLKVFPDDSAPSEKVKFAMIAVRSEYSPFQVAVRSESAVKNVSVKIGDFKGSAGTIPASDINLLLVKSVTIEKPSTNATRKVWPDPLPPYHDFDLEAGVTQPVWFDLFVRESVKPGVYNGVVTVEAPGSKKIELPVELTVRDLVVPVVPHVKTAFGLGFGGPMNAHKIKDGTPEARKLKDAYYWFLVEHRLSPYHIPVDFFSEEAANYLDDPRVTFLRAPLSWDKNKMRQIAERLRTTGWIEKAYYYEVDEPTLEGMQEINKIGKWLHSYNPKIKLLATTGHNVNLKEADVDVWCPTLTFTLDSNKMSALRKDMGRGKEFWWYTCIGPKWVGTDYFIDEEATAPRALTWMNFLYGVTGVLYWSTTSWGRVDDNPWKKTETFPAGNGDGSLLYPGSEVGYDGPVASIRLKIIRESMEDYELFYQLGERLRMAANTLGGAALEYEPSMRQFEHAYAMITPDGRTNPLGRKTPYLMFVSRDYTQFEAERDKIVDEIERVAAEPLLIVDTDPCDNSITPKSKVKVTAYAREGAEVTVNGNAAKAEGVKFISVVEIKKGENKITVTAKLNGKEKTETRTIYGR